MFKLKDKQAAMLAAAKEFISGTPIQEVMQKHNVSYASVYNAIKRNNLEYDYPGNRSVHFNTRYFQNIDNEHKAYWLGFLFADGSITKTDKSCSQLNRVSLSISQHDSIIIKQFADDISMPREQIKHLVQTRGFKPGAEFIFIQCNSVDMVNDLMSHGFTQRKRDRESIPELSHDLMNHFIRGYFDGDGSISTEFNITSERNVLPLIYEILVKECSIPRTKISYTKNSYRIRWGGTNSIEKIATYLYENATVYLQRKLDKFCERCFRN